MQKIKIALVSSANLRGGAGRSVLRLHRGLRELGADSTLLVDAGNRDLLEAGVEVISQSATRDAWRIEMLQDCIRRKRTPLSNTYFSCGYPGIDLRAEPAIQGADVINLHWVAGMLSAQSVAALAATGKPVAWTLHDQRPFTGGCHFSAGCKQYQTACAECPQLLEDVRAIPAANLADEIRFLRDAGVRIASPSHWLAQCARESAVFGASPAEVIPAGVETDVFKAAAKREARSALGLAPDGFHLLFGADYGEEKRKGFRELSEALQFCAQDPDFNRRVDSKEITIAYFGRVSKEIEALGIPVHAHGKISSDEKMALLYSSASVYLLPSLEDNLPNTVLECMSCGTPAIAFNTGGIPDLVHDGKNGRLVPPGDSRAMADAILDASRIPGTFEAMAAVCRSGVEEGYTLGHYASQYMRYFESLLPGGHGPAASAPTVDGFGPNLSKLMPGLVIKTLRERLRSRIRSLPLVGRFA